MTKLKTILSKIRVPKISAPNIKLDINIIRPVLKGLKKSLEWLLKGAKGLIRWFGKAVKESIAQVWTLLGFFIAWLTLTGTAQQIVGIATLAATVLWLITIPLREEKE